MSLGSIEEVNAAAEGAGLPPFTLDLTDVGVRSDWFEARARALARDRAQISLISRNRSSR